jgi:hypothetical protein
VDWVDEDEALFSGKSRRVHMYASCMWYLTKSHQYQDWFSKSVQSF